MTINVNIMTKTEGPLVVALLYDGLCTFEFGIVAEIFGLSRPELGTSWYRFASVPVEDGPLRAHGGFTIHADATAELMDEADLIVIPGWRGVDEAVPDTLIDRLRAARVRGARLASICSGAFVLAATGLLDGGTATTHWRYADALRRRFPRISVDEASLYREQDGVFTSAGSAAGIDLLIEIVRQDFGTRAANSVARRIILPAHRHGDQAQFLERPIALRENASLAPLLDQVRARFNERWTNEAWARTARMSPRTFLRRFAEATGTSPGEWLTGIRLEAAKQMLCETSRSIEEIADAVGMGSAFTLRHHFRQRLQVSPAQYRHQFADKRPAAGSPALPH